MQSKTTKLLAMISILPMLGACGTMTGLPGHGGGKRFAIEQELISAASRATVKDMQLEALAGRNVALYVSTMGDQGSGSMVGGRFSIDGLIRGRYHSDPTSHVQYEYPEYTSVADTVSGSLTSTTTSTSLLNAPSSVRTKSDGGSHESSARISANGLGEYRNETLITNPRDVVYLSNLIQTLFYLRGINVVPTNMADTDVFITVDVFGTVRSRTETYLYNAEKLQAITKLEYLAVDRASRDLVIKPTSKAYQAVYKENYFLWAGPLQTTKETSAAEQLMVNFSDITPYAKSEHNAAHPAGAPDWEDNVIDIPEVSDEVIRKRRAETSQ